MPAIIVERVSKYYSIDRKRGKRTGSDEPARSNRFDPARGFAALRDISFRVEHGGATALVGENGAGKTTMLKILAGVTRPTEGSLQLAGRSAALLSLKAGMSPKLSGRENVYLYGALLGFGARWIEARLPEIIEFSELHDFIDQPMASYSPGMGARLAFATAVNLEAKILLIDEILAVGDPAFQSRAYRRMENMFETGLAAIVASHNLVAIQKLCSHAVWIHHGRIRNSGTTEEVIPLYRAFCDRHSASPE